MQEVAQQPCVMGSQLRTRLDHDAILRGSVARARAARVGNVGSAGWGFLVIDDQ